MIVNTRDYNILINGFNISGLLFANLLLKNNCDSVTINIDRRADNYRFSNTEFNVLLSSINDIEGIVDFTLSKLDINISDYVKKVEYPDAYISNDNKIVYRNACFNKWKQDLIEIYNLSDDKICSFFDIVNDISKENWQALKNSNKTNFKNFFKYHKMTYKDLIDSFNFSNNLKSNLLAYAPWDGISLITMCGYLEQITKVSPITNNISELRRKLLELFTSSGGIVINKEIKNVEDKNSFVSIETKDNIQITSSYFIETGDRNYLKKLGLMNIKDNNEKDRFGTVIYFIDLGEKISNKLEHNIISVYLNIEVLNRVFKIKLSYLESKVIKVEVSGDFHKINENTILTKLHSRLIETFNIQHFNIVKKLNFNEVFERTGISDGQINRWAHSCNEILSNPLNNLKVTENTFAMGDWGNGFFYSGEIYSRYLINKINKLRVG